MHRNVNTIMRQCHGMETAEEIIGVLTAISVVSKRMARKLALMERTLIRKECSNRNEQSRRLSRNAYKGRAV